MSRTSLPRFVAALVALLLVAAACAADDPPAIVTSGQDPVTAPRDIVDTAATAGLNTLVAAVQAAGLEDELRSEGPFTVFAPTDAAFAALPPGTVDALLEPANRSLLTDILTYHVAEDLLLAADLVEAGSAETLEGSSVTVLATEEPPATEGAEPTTVVTVGGTPVTTPDLLTTNGVVHVIDEVLVPPGSNAELQALIAGLPETLGLVATAERAGNFTTLLAALEATGLDAALLGDGPFTVFAPTDAAFAKLPTTTLDALFADPDTLTEVLSYHVLGRRFATTDVSVRQYVPTITGEAVIMARTGDEVTVNDVPIVTGDIVSTNGLIHVIDEVLVPSSVRLP